jgi:hypothetical protein
MKKWILSPPRLPIPPSRLFVLQQMYYNTKTDGVKTFIIYIQSRKIHSFTLKRRSYSGFRSLVAIAFSPGGNLPSMTYLAYLYAYSASLAIAASPSGHLPLITSTA